MRRREFVLLAAGAAVARPVAAHAQSARVYRLGVLTPGQETIERIRGTVLPELARLGFAEGRNLALEVRIGQGDQLPALARDLAATHPDAVIAVSVPAIQAMREASDKTPIVGAFIGSDPIAAGFAASLAHPGGMITGVLMLATRTTAPSVTRGTPAGSPRRRSPAERTERSRVDHGGQASGCPASLVLRRNPE
jgi:putative tryptophan/tyrosine transport system substrate-binding protein